MGDKNFRKEVDWGQVNTVHLTTEDQYSQFLVCHVANAPRG
jgi:hypothetical protein